MDATYASPVSGNSYSSVPRSATCTDVPWKMGLGERFPVIFKPASLCSTSQHVIGGWWLTCSAIISTSPTRVRCVSPSTEFMGFFIGGIVNALLVPPPVPSSQRSDSMSRNSRSTFRNRVSASREASDNAFQSSSLRSVPAMIVSTSSEAWIALNGVRNVAGSSNLVMSCPSCMRPTTPFA